MTNQSKVLTKERIQHFYQQAIEDILQHFKGYIKIPKAQMLKRYTACKNCFFLSKYFQHENISHSPFSCKQHNNIKQPANLTLDVAGAMISSVN